MHFQLPFGERKREKKKKKHTWICVNLTERVQIRFRKAFKSSPPSSSSRRPL